MKHRALVDAGPLVALLRRSDSHHAACVDVLGELRKPLLTTLAPVAEAMYLLDRSVDAQCGLLAMLEREIVKLVELDPSDMGPIAKLMKQYEDLPMDFADATLVRVAEKLDIRHVFTLDRKGFGVYRLPRRRGFTILPGEH